MGTLGGAGRGQGRKKGVPSQKTLMLKALADKALETGLTPLDIMLDNMRFYHHKAEKLLARVESMVNCSDKDAVFALAKFGEARMKAQQCAQEAANYVHPRLSAVAVKGIGEGDNVTFNLIIFDSQQQITNQPKSVRELIFRETHTTYPIEDLT